MKLQLHRLDGGTSITQFLDALDIGGIEVDPGSTLEVAGGTVFHVREVTPEAYVLRVVPDEGQRWDTTHQRPFTRTQRTTDGGWADCFTPHGYRWSQIREMVTARHGDAAPLQADEIATLGLPPDAEDSKDGTWRLWDLTERQLWKLAERRGIG